MRKSKILEYPLVRRDPETGRFEPLSSGYAANVIIPNSYISRAPYDIQDIVRRAGRLRIYNHICSFWNSGFMFELRELTIYSVEDPYTWLRTEMEYNYMNQYHSPTRRK